MVVCMSCIIWFWQAKSSIPYKTVRSHLLDRKIILITLRGVYLFLLWILNFVLSIMLLCMQVQAELKKRFWKWQTQSYLSYSKRRRTLFTESSTVTQISVLDKSSPKEHLASETDTLTASSVSPVWAGFDLNFSTVGSPAGSHLDWQILQQLTWAELNIFTIFTPLLLSKLY